MGIPDFFNDSPIVNPEQDRFGIDPFARALAQSFKELKSPVGATVALNGAWGAGKSSAVNLIRHHLSVLKDDNLVVVDFKCWWFRGEEALTLAFLQALNGAIEKSLGEKARQLLPNIGKKLLQAGPVIGPAINMATAGLWGTLTSGSLDFVKKFFADGEGVEKIFNQLSEALAKLNRRFLVIIDDIDRLTPDEALLIFRLVKSVGRLPNVMYLLVFDRELAEKSVEEPWRRIRKLADLDDVRIHDLRHTYASQALALGQTLPLIGKLLGHTQVQTTARYAHLAADPVRHAAAEVANHVKSALNGNAIRDELQ